MSCNCNKAKPLPSCLTSLVLGSVADTSQDYNVIFETPDGRRDIYEAFNVYQTTTMAVEPTYLRVGTQYKVWLTLASAANVETKTTLTIGDTETDCIEVEFYQVHGDDNDLETFATQTISLV